MTTLATFSVPGGAERSASLPCVTLCHATNSSTHSSRSGLTPEQLDSLNLVKECLARKTHTTPTTTPPSGQSTGESRSQPEEAPGDPYGAICRDLHALLTRKRGYYGCRENPLQNALGVAEDGIEPWVYQLARIGEKRRRLSGPLETVDIVKTLMDIAGHAVVAIACLQHKESR